MRKSAAIVAGGRATQFGGRDKSALVADIVVTQTDRGYHPLCAVDARACVDPDRAPARQTAIVSRA